MYYYKTIKEDGSLDSLQSCSDDISVYDTDLIPISEKEFDEISAEMCKKASEEEMLANEAIIAKQKRIENLEKENAALLFQMLTGEEYADV